MNSSVGVFNLYVTKIHFVRCPVVLITKGAQRGTLRFEDSERGTFINSIFSLQQLFSDEHAKRALIPASELY